MNITKKAFGTTPDGQEVELYTLTNDNDMTIKITSYGAIVVSLFVPDQDGKVADVVLGYEKLDGYLQNDPYFGCIVGRYANRIAKGKFSLEGREYTLAQNNGENALHGGLVGFNKVVWECETVQTDDIVGVRLSYLSKNGEEGYPGNLNVNILYSINNNNELKIDCEATTDKATVINLTHHGYFNLKGHDTGDILNHEVTINADRYTPTDETAIPTGELADVDGTPMDFRSATTIGARIEDDFEQLKLGNGYDHNWVINRSKDDLALAAKAVDKTSGRVLEVFTTKPGVQFYTGNFIEGQKGKDGAVYKKRGGFCFEPQFFPDSPNQPQFPSAVLHPGEVYQHKMAYKFSVSK